MPEVFRPRETPLLTGIKRMINRQKLHLDDLEKELKDINSLRHQVFENFLALLDSRKRIRSFHPGGSKRVVDIDRRLVSIERRFGREKILAIINVSDEAIDLPRYELRFDLIKRSLFDGKVDPYGVYALE